MKFGKLITAGAFAIAAMAASTASASLVDIVDGGGQTAAFPQGGLTLDVDAVDTGVFDTTSTRFNFRGGGSGMDSFQISTTGTFVMQFGNLVLPGDFSTATITIDGTLIDLITNPSEMIPVTVSSPFTVETNFVAENPAGTYDFTLIAQPVPVPAGILLMGTALAGFGVMRRRKAKKAS